MACAQWSGCSTSCACQEPRSVRPGASRDDPLRSLRLPGANRRGGLQSDGGGDPALLPVLIAPGSLAGARLPALELAAHALEEAGVRRSLGYAPREIGLEPLDLVPLGGTWSLSRLDELAHLLIEQTL